MKYKCNICGWTNGGKVYDYDVAEKHEKEHKSVSGTLGKRIERRQRKI
mgnify:CR=1 FL=1